MTEGFLVEAEAEPGAASGRGLEFEQWSLGGAKAADGSLEKTFYLELPASFMMTAGTGEHEREACVTGHG